MHPTSRLLFVLALGLVAVACASVSAAPAASGASTTAAQTATATTAAAVNVSATATAPPTAALTPAPTATAEAPLRLVVLGDSITAWGSWPAAVDAASPHLVLVHNAGVAGNTTAQMLVRLDRDVLAYQPDVVVLMGGTNDRCLRSQPATVTQAAANLRAIIERLHAAGVVVVLMTIPPCLGLAHILPMNAAIRRLAAVEGTPLVDIYAALVGKGDAYVPAYQCGDGIHPSAAGYARMAQAILAVTSQLWPEWQSARGEPKD